MPECAATCSGELRGGRVSGPTQPSEPMHRLSMVHKTRKPKTQRVFQIWKKGSLAIFPAIPNLDPKNIKSDQSRGGNRGKVTTLSHASRRNLMTYLATLNRDAQLYTMALTLPGDVSLLTSVKVHEAFKVLCNRFTASKRFESVAFVWKRELQRRGVLHYHLMITGLSEDQGQQPLGFQLWIAKEWNQLVCEGLSDEEKRKHLSWHNHSKNMEKVRGNIFGYFAKYIGKPLETVHEEIPGRWWGKVNAKALPIAKKSELVMPERAAIIAHRLARKITRKRADAAKHYNTFRQLGWIDCNNQPLLTQLELIAGKHRHLTKGRQGRYDDLFYFASQEGVRWGKAKTPKFTRFYKLKLISNQSTDTALAILRYTEMAMKDWVERNPF